MGAESDEVKLRTELETRVSYNTLSLLLTELCPTVLESNLAHQCCRGIEAKQQDKRVVNVAKIFHEIKVYCEEN